ncbi:MAG: hybrid sensor histidine kinase/response regulator [Thermoflexales bacterium]|nr:hybrid sensor histidine kinase/response regulator [Thermoflexales bacterium]
MAKTKIVVIEEDPVLAQSIRDRLADMGYCVTVASVGESVDAQSDAVLVDKLRRSNAELKHYMHELREANRLKDLFTDILRHDLLNPANVIRDFAKLLLADLGDAGQQRIVSRIMSSADKIMEMIEDASMYAKLESVDKLDREGLNLDRMFRTVIDNLGPLLDKKGLSLDYLPQGDYYVLANPMLEAVLSNLLSNAIKYSPDGRRVEINILALPASPDAPAGQSGTTGAQNGCVWFYVKDWGYGIAAEDKTRVFTRFQRADKTGVKGSGLGLAIVKRIVELHAGRVWVEDNPEGGSVFYVEIPLDPKAGDPADRLGSRQGIIKKEVPDGKRSS